MKVLMLLDWEGRIIHLSNKFRHYKLSVGYNLYTKGFNDMKSGNVIISGEVL